MSADNIFRLPLRNGPRRSDGGTQDRCDDPIHVYAFVPGWCQCGDHFWDFVPPSAAAGSAATEEETR